MFVRPPLPPHPATVIQPKGPPHPARSRLERPPHPALIQRRSPPPFAADRRPPAPVLQRIAAPASGGAASVPRSAFLVEDSDSPGDGQVKKSQFLAALRSKVTAAAAGVLDAAGQSARYCPYIPYWFQYYEDRSAQHVEQAILRYAPGAASAKTWQECADRVTDHVQKAFKANVATGSLAGVPPGLPLDLEASLSVQPKAAPGVLQRRTGSKARREKEISDQIDKENEAKLERISRWREVVPLTTKVEIVFRKLSKVAVFNPSADEKYRPIDRLDFEQNEAHEGISLTRNPYFTADLITRGKDKVVYACALPKGGAYDLEAAYLKYHAENFGGVPVEYTSEGLASKLSKEVTAESVPSDCIIGWISRNDLGVVYHAKSKEDYSALDTYERFEQWMAIYEKAAVKV